ncbi:MAG: hypothetical protein QXW78_02245 [Candidatus Thermoplasmatota archaeon]
MENSRGKEINGHGGKIKKARVVFLVLTMALAPIMQAAVSSAIERGDVVFGKMYYPIPQIPEWHHACLYRGANYIGKDIVQSDPHFELWTLQEKLWWFTGQYENLQQSLNNRNVGGVEYTILSYIHQTYNKVAYGNVWTANEYQRNNSVKFAEDRIGRHFDILSYWKYKDKQIDGPANDRSGWYYCAELVWAGYWGYNIDLDPGDTATDRRVYPREIYHDNDVKIIYDEGIGW